MTDSGKPESEAEQLAQRLAQQMDEFKRLADASGIGKRMEEFASFGKLAREVTIPTFPSWDRTAYLTAIEGPNPARDAYNLLRRRIATFESSLDQTYEIVIRLGNFSTDVAFRLEQLAALGSAFVAFMGRDGEGAPVEVIQHVNQVTMVLSAVKRGDASQPRRAIGFSE